MSDKDGSRELVKVIVQAAVDRLGQDIVVLDVAGLTPLADYFVIVTGKNQRQINALVHAVQEKVEESGYTIKSTEGGPGTEWVLIDCVDVIVHIFSRREREYYNLEKLWSKAPRLDVEEGLEISDEG